MKKNVWVCLLLTALLVCSLGSIAMAAANAPDVTTNDPEAAQPRYSYTSSLGVTGAITRSTGKLMFDVFLETYEPCKVYISTKLQRLDENGWTTVATFRNPSSGTTTGDSFLYTNSYYVDTSYSYRLVTSAEVTSVATGYYEYPSATQSNVIYR